MLVGIDCCLDFCCLLFMLHCLFTCFGLVCVLLHLLVRFWVVCHVVCFVSCVIRWIFGLLWFGLLC